ncbi:MAG: fasciclin domain-containing protein [Rickettsiales bacterium]|jgi:uncharacterized surface protein with fasciclin (FAS1) repeats|nr:fasciclin domain-containing protein [Rickettsiales bacterium]
MKNNLITTLAIALLVSTSAASISFAGNSSHAEAVAKKDVIDIAVGDGNFKTLASLLTKAELVETLKGEGPFTVFAPTDAAFAKLPKQTIADLQKPENAAKLKQILTYHVVPGKVFSKDIKGKKLSPETVAGSNLSIDATSGTVNVNQSKVTKADIEGSNGVIHVIDTVLLPSE